MQLTLNNNQEIRKYLNTYPFTTNEIDITIYPLDPKPGMCVDDYMSYGEMNYNKLQYSILDKFTYPRRKTKLIETFEEAEELLKKSEHL